MKLLPRHLLIKTGDVDFPDWNYRLGLGWIQRQRFRLAVELLGQLRVERLLEIGFGSGVFSPQLARYTDALIGVDIHQHPAAVASRLLDFGVRAELSEASAVSLPFDSDSFGCVLAMSCLELIDDLPRACREVRRVMAPGSVFIVVTPGHSVIVDLGLKVVTGERTDAYRNERGDRRRGVHRALVESFEIDARLSFPSGPGSRLLPRLYAAYRLR